MKVTQNFMLDELHKLFKLIWQKKKCCVITNHENIFFYSVWAHNFMR